MVPKFFAAAAFAAATPAFADFDPDEYPRYETCALCHGLFGVSHTSKFPHLAGQDPVYIENQLRAFLSGTRSNDGGQMAAIVTELQPGDVDVVVDWFSSQDPPTPSSSGAETKGPEIYADAGCGFCHDMAASLPGVPYLTAQHADYLEKQMLDLRDNRRGSGELNVDHAALQTLSDASLLAIATYLAREPRK